MSPGGLNQPNVSPCISIYTRVQFIKVIWVLAGTSFNELDLGLVKMTFVESRHGRALDDLGEGRVRPDEDSGRGKGRSGGDV